MDMSLLILGGGLLAAFLGHEIFSDDDDDDNDNTAADGVTDDDVKVDDDFAGGNNGDNEIVQTVTADGIENFMTAYGMGGNDTITMISGGSAYGGTGDDVLIVEDHLRLPTILPGGDDAYDLYDRDTIDGGAGNDKIEVDRVVDTQINGGEGDDTISYEEAEDFPANNYVPNDIDAGAGDDVIDATVEVGADDKPLGVTLGEGQDTLSIEFDMDDIFIGTVIDEQGMFRGHDAGVVVTDFNPDEDILVIEPDTDPKNFATDYPGAHDAALTYDGVTIVEAKGNTYVVIRYAENIPDEPDDYSVGVTGVSSVVVLQGVTGVPASAIKVVTG